MRRSLLSFACLAVVFAFVSVGLVQAQSAASATIAGRVTDPQGAVVANATVSAQNMATGIQVTSKTTSDGLYRFPNLAPGDYNVQVQAGQSFTAAQAKGIHLEVGAVRDVNFKLALAGVATAVEVTGETPLLETTKTDVSNVVSDADMEKLPVYQAFGGGANDYANLAAIAPGVKFDTSTITNGSGLGDLIGPGSVNNRANLINVNGGNVIDLVDSGRDGLGASVDEVKEFQVLTNNYNAEYGQAGGLVLNVVTKSGSNQLHGSGYTYFRGRNLSSSNFFYNRGLFQDPKDNCPRNAVGATSTSSGTLTTLDGCPRAPFHRKEGGFTLGGPFVKDRAFWFVNFEDTKAGTPITITPPSGGVTLQSP